jgi:SlyX protein
MVDEGFAGIGTLDDATPVPPRTGPRQRIGSNRLMTYPQDLADVDRRLVDLEIKATFTEDTLDALNQVIVRQQEQIDLLVREVKRLRDERPPHY